MELKTLTENQIKFFRILDKYTESSVEEFMEQALKQNGSVKTLLATVDRYGPDAVFRAIL